jgi:ATP-dependent Lhr-like helicase
VEEYDVAQLTRLAASGTLVWAAEGRGTSGQPQAGSPGVVGRIRFFERGTGRLWLADAPDDAMLGDAARAVREALRAQGASFTADLSATGLTSTQVRDALRELVAAGIVTNDTVEALRDVLRWKPVFPIRRRDEPDPTRWLPADFTPSARPIVQRRVNPRRLAKWRRPDREEAQSWGGRWSLVHMPGTLGPPADEQELAERIARQWLARYGIVSRDWWRREKPAVGWRPIYHELKRLEFRGEVRRGYFVAGLAGAQFALPEAVELLRAPSGEEGEAEGEGPAIAFATSDPSNVYTLPVAAGTEVDPLARPRGAGATLVTRAGRIVLAAERRGARLRVRHDATPVEVAAAVRALAERLLAQQERMRRRDLIVETIDGERAVSSRWASVLRDAGFRSMGTGLRYYVDVR